MRPRTYSLFLTAALLLAPLAAHADSDTLKEDIRNCGVMTLVAKSMINSKIAGESQEQQLQSAQETFKSKHDAALAGAMLKRVYAGEYKNQKQATGFMLSLLTQCLEQRGQPNVPASLLQACTLHGSLAADIHTLRQRHTARPEIEAWLDQQYEGAVSNYLGESLPRYMRYADESSSVLWPADLIANCVSRNLADSHAGPPTL